MSVTTAFSTSPTGEEIRYVLPIRPMMRLPLSAQLTQITFRRFQYNSVEGIQCMDCKRAGVEWIGPAYGALAHVDAHADMMAWAAPILLRGPEKFTTLNHADVLEVDRELARASKHGIVFASLHEAYAVTLEELDEIWDVARQKKKDRNREALRKEWIQIAAMAHKALTSMSNFVGGDV